MDTKQEIKIYDPNDVPYGPLSNNYIHYMRIDEKNWSTVTNYVLSNMINTPIYKLALQNASTFGKKKNINLDEKVNDSINLLEVKLKRQLTYSEKQDIKNAITQDNDIEGKDIYQLYKYYSQKEKVDIIKLATENAYDAKMEDEEFKQALINTGQSEIVYENEAEFFEPELKNIIGKILMNLRNNLLKKIVYEKNLEKELKKQDEIFNIYKAYVILNIELDQGKDLFNYDNLSSSQIIEKYYNTLKDKIISFMEQKEKDSKDSSEKMWKILSNEKVSGYLPEVYMKDLNIKELKKKSYEELIQILPLPVVFKKGKVEDDLKPLVITLYKKGRYPILKYELENPGSLAYILRKINIDKLREMLEIEKRIMITNLYTEYIIRKNYPNMSDTDIEIESKKLYLASKSINDYFTLRNKITNLYKLGFLPKDITLKITTELSKFKDIKDTPFEIDKNTLLEIAGSEKINSSSSTEEKDEIAKKLKTVLREEKETLLEKETVLREEKKDTVFISNNIDKVRDEFKPLCQTFNKNFKIKTMVYPNVYSYVMTQLLIKSGKEKILKPSNAVSFERVMSENDARKMVLESKENLYEIYLINLKKVQELLINSLCLKALKVKFENNFFMSILELTGSKNIVWNDVNDPFLGVGNDGKGDNGCGKMLMNIRNNIQNYIDKNTELAKIFKNTISDKSLPYLLMNDPFLSSWVSMRLKDFCKTVFKFKNYMKDMAKIDEIINTDFIMTVINNVYHCCGISIGQIQEMKLLQEMKLPYNTKEQFQINTKEQIQIKKDFMSLVQYTCSGLRTKIDSKYSKEIQQLEKTKEIEMLSFWGNNSEYINKENEKSEFIKQQKEEYNKYINNPRGKPSEQDIENFKLAQEIEFKFKYEEDEEQIKNVDYSKKTSLEMKNYEEKQQIVEKKISELESKRKEALEEISNNIVNISNLYFHYLLIIIYEGKKLNNIKTIQSLRNMIIQAQDYNNKNLQCTEKTLGNCINSALINILKGIEIFKYNYCEEIPLNTQDIDLAVSVILNTDIKPLKKLSKDEDEDINYVPTNYEDKEDEEEQKYTYIPDPDINYVPTNYKDEQEQEYDEGERFYMGSKNNPDEELENVKINLREISNNKLLNFDVLAKYFIRSSFKIKKYKFSKNKHNRVMFFADTNTQSEGYLWNFFDILKQKK